MNALKHNQKVRPQLELFLALVIILGSDRMIQNEVEVLVAKDGSMVLMVGQIDLSDEDCCLLIFMVADIETEKTDNMGKTVF